MYRIETIKKSWINLIAWRQQYDPNGAQIEEALTQGESGMYYQEGHPMLTLPNLESIMPDFSVINYPNWDNATSYQAGAIVTHSGQTWEAQRDNLNITPVQGDDWKPHNPFSNWLKEKTEAGITDTVVNYLERKELLGTAKTLLEDKTLFHGVGKLKDTITNQDRRAGFEIITGRTQGLTCRLDRIGLQMSAPGEVTVYLHHSSRLSALKTLICDYTRNGDIQWFDLNWELPSVSDDVDSGGAYYLTYKQSALAADVQAIKKERTWDGMPCESCCSKTEYNTWRTMSPHVQFSPFNVPETAGNDLWDIEDNRYTESSNYGINLALTLYCDYTDYLVKQRDLFKSALRMQVAINLLRELAYNPNSKVTQGTKSVSKEQLLYEIDGDSRGRNTGLNKKYQQALDAITLNVKGLNRLCLPCRKKGVKYRTI